MLALRHPYLGLDRSPVSATAHDATVTSGRVAPSPGSPFRRSAVLLIAAFLLAHTAIAEDEAKASFWERLGRLSGLHGEGAPEPPLRRLPELPSDDELVAAGAVIGRVTVDTVEIFDTSRPDENLAVFRFANAIHINTRPATIARFLLFRPGDRYDPSRIRESERTLRTLPFLFDAWVVPVGFADGLVDIAVVTRDVWSLGLGAGFSREGGSNTMHLAVEESNFLGTGRDVELRWENDPDRNAIRLRYTDLAFGGTRAQLRLWFADNSDGKRRIFDLEQPFFSLHSRWAAAGKAISDERLERIYRQGEVENRFVHSSTFVEASGGLSRGLTEGRSKRYRLGVTFDKHRFSRDVDWPGRTPPPEGRTIAALWFGFERIPDEFVRRHHLSQLGRTEDLNLGVELDSRIGVSAEALGADKNQLIAALSARSTSAFNGPRTLIVAGGFSGRFGNDPGVEDLRVQGQLQLFLPTFGGHKLFLGVIGDALIEGAPERQLLLGGETGLRGYPRRFQEGDRRFVFTIEQRFYTDLELFKLAHVGAAVFADLGRAWTDDGSRPDLGTLADVGVGLRLGASRSARGRMLHLDVAWPLDGDEQSLQLTISQRHSF